MRTVPRRNSVGRVPPRGAGVAQQGAGSGDPAYKRAPGQSDNIKA
jgi:hypothetical protein